MLDGLDYVGLENHFVMLGAEFAGEGSPPLGFVEIFFLEADRESLHRPGAGARHQGNNSRRIDATAEECAERNVGDEAYLCCFKQTMLQLFETFFLALRSMRVVRGKVPILADGYSSLFKSQKVSGGQLVNSGERTGGIGDVSIIEIFEKALRVDFGEFGYDRQNRFYFGTEIKISFVQGVVQRLFAKAVAGQNQFAFGLVVNG